MSPEGGHDLAAREDASRLDRAPRPRSFLVAIAFALLLAAAPAHADNFTVTKRGDPAPDGCKKRDCSLREAVLAAHERPGADVVELPNRRKPYTLKLGGIQENLGLVGDLDVLNDPLVIRHPGKGRAKIDGNEIDRVLDVHPGAPTTLRKLVITGGREASTDGFGGGIRSDADLKVINSRVVRNFSMRSGGGILLQSGASLRLERSVVAGNETAPGAGSGGIGGDSGAIVILRSKILRNSTGDGAGGIAYQCPRSREPKRRFAWGAQPRSRTPPEPAGEVGPRVVPVVVQTA